MCRLLAVIALVLGTLTAGFASVTYLKLRQLAVGAGSIDVLDHFGYRMMTLGMRDDPSADVVSATDFVQRLQARISIVLGCGLALLLLGGAMLRQSRRFRHGRCVGRGAAGIAVPNS